ncbi:hypothetical protein [Oleiharenicola sp. Vm1]|uniref:hypothetical protein n=1 Tax=Oleiharenicola sp. Vm1 TaxID=3398393 RepID=UPI0039F4F49B
MLRRLSPVSPPPRSSRWLAALLAVTVWALGVLAASPELHAALHGDSGDHAHECAVTLFAHGAAALDAAPALHRVTDARELGRVAAPRTHDWAPPHYLLRPACGPPRC